MKKHVEVIKNLTPTETDVMRFMTIYNAEETARELNLAHDYVIDVIRIVRKKFGVSTNDQAVELYERLCCEY